MNAIATTICIVVALLCWTLLRIRGQALEVAAEAKRLDQEAAALKAQADLTRDMADKGYVQVPVIKEHTAEATSGEDDEDWDDEDSETFSEHRSWQLAWVPKDQLDMMVMAAHTDAEAEDIIKAALRPT